MNIFSSAKHFFQNYRGYFLAFAATTLISVSANVFWDHSKDLMTKNIVNNWPYWSPFAILLFCCVNMVYVMMASESIQRLNDSRLVNIRFLRSETDEDKIRLFEESRNIIEKVELDKQSYVRAANSFLELYSDPSYSHPKVKQAIRNYFESIESKSDRINYERLVQMPKHKGYNSSDLCKIIGASYNKHFWNICGHIGLSKGHTRFKLKIVEPVYPTSFVLIENKSGTKYIIWQINKHIHQPSADVAFSIEAVFLFDNPDDATYNAFLSWWNMMDKNPICDITRNILNDPDCMENSIKKLYRLIDNKKWDDVLELFDDKIEYIRDEKTYTHKSELEAFYKIIRNFETSAHKNIKYTLISDNEIKATGKFKGTQSKPKIEEVDLTFTDLFRFDNGKIIYRNTQTKKSSKKGDFEI